MNQNNITNPNSTYIKIQLKFKGYKQYHLHAYIDTGASICIANKNALPPETWEEAKIPIKVQIADKSNLSLDKVARNLQIKIAGTEFLIPTVYQQETGMDFLIGNNFLHLYEPFIQRLNYIVLHTKKHEAVHITKVSKALSFATSPKFIEFQRKHKRGEVIQKPDQPINIASNQFPEQPQILYYIKQNAIEQLLNQVSSDHPLDPTINKAQYKAEIILKDPTKIIRVKPMKYTPRDRDEFAKQIKELLLLKVIRPSKSPHSSPAFMVENHSEIKRGKSNQ